MSGIGTCLWFDGKAKEAANFYVGLFPNSRIIQASRLGDAGPGKLGSVLAISFELDGRSFMGLNGGPQFTFNEPISFVLTFAGQAELDEKWDALTADGGMESQCGWLKEPWRR